jgi:hypothetical protein
MITMPGELLHRPATGGIITYESKGQKLLFPQSLETVNSVCFSVWETLIVVQSAVF